MELNYKGDVLRFYKVELIFEYKNMINIFANLDDKSLKEALEHYRYQKLKKDVNESYSSFLNIRLGSQLGRRKNDCQQKIIFTSLR